MENSLLAAIFLIVILLVVIFIMCTPKTQPAAPTTPTSGLMSSSSFSVSASIQNNSPFYITITGTGPGNTSSPIYPSGSYNWSSSEVYNTKNVLFWENSSATGTPVMQGNIAFGPSSGVYLDRGWQATQTVQMRSNTNGVEFVQNTNGGKQVLAWNEFQSGGSININYTVISS